MTFYRLVFTGGFLPAEPAGKSITGGFPDYCRRFSPPNLLQKNMKVEVVSNEIIKPSSPTPDHFRHYQLSFLDHLSPQTYNPLVLFYQLDVDDDDDQDHESKIKEISDKVKNSLSEVLTLFYPLAGRVKNDRFIYCNDEGVSYSVTRVKSPCHLSQAIKNPLPSELCNFLPFKLNELNEFALGVQLNVFERGGVALGLCISHQIADALSSIMFIKTWVAIARGEANHLPHPEFVSAKLFPPLDGPKFDPNNVISSEVISKRFVFEGSTLEAIRSKYEKNTCLEGERRPSRVEALSAFIWSRFVAATSCDNDNELSAGTEKVYAVIHAVNLRPKLDPPLPEHSFGNLYRYSYAIFPSTILSSSEKDNYGYEAMKQIRAGFEKVDMDYLRKVQEGEDVKLEQFTEYAEELLMKGGELVSFAFTSLCRFPLYDADFGWGKPTWVSSASLDYENLVAFMDTKTGNGIETYVSLKTEKMAKHEDDKEFIIATSALPLET
ncbi:stemmadenine O-acetyltransferase-like [Humulus lupulus]|uniref:stemmadenine O-acetyltransferase-like n=1 Tax=Humulus lupulus TaxID=3486 RepID=UPI002B4046BB|nr:stemmadenine O-acetyltransferase-like [Humulus lupulus]